MPLDVTQRATLAAHIKANTDPDVVAALAGRNDTELARLYNLPGSFVVWRESISPEEYREDIAWTEVDALAAGKARIWEWVTQNMSAPVDATKANVRQGIVDCFGNGSTTLTALIDLAKENASVAEEIFATGTGSTGQPGTRVVIGPIATVDDLSRALNENP